MSIPRYSTQDPDFRRVFAALRAKLSPQGDVVSEGGRRKTLEVFGEPLTPQQVVDRICREVRERGVSAVLEYSQKLDGAELNAGDLRVSAAEMEAAHRSVAPEFLETVRRVRDNIAAFQQAILHRDVAFRPGEGITLEQRYVPLRRIGICVPGGAAAYPSTVLMTAVPALTAGVDEIAVMAPPTPFGANNPDVLATCWEIGVREVYRMGGAHGVAALAYGLEGLPRVDKIVGPGNLFVALAKKLVYGQVDIDSIAGPSEVVVVTDRSTPAAFTASDLLAQAEHAPGSSVLFSWEDGVIDAVAEALEQQLKELDRADLTRQSLEQFGALVQVSSRDEAIDLTNEIAPEHLHLSCAAAREMLSRIRNAGATFVGPYSPVALGDYAAGPSHVLPTSGTARWASGLTANDFLRGGSVIEFDQQALRQLSEDVCRLATKEGLTAHRKSVEVRT